MHNAALFWFWDSVLNFILPFPSVPYQGTDLSWFLLQSKIVYRKNYLIQYRLIMQFWNKRKNPFGKKQKQEKRSFLQSGRRSCQYHLWACFWAPGARHRSLGGHHCSSWQSRACFWAPGARAGALAAPRWASKLLFLWWRWIKITSGHARPKIADSLCHRCLLACFWAPDACRRSLGGHCCSPWQSCTQITYWMQMLSGNDDYNDQWHVFIALQTCSISCWHECGCMSWWSEG